eukprot:gene11301-biopygen7802
MSPPASVHSLVVHAPVISQIPGKLHAPCISLLAQRHLVHQKYQHCTAQRLTRVYDAVNVVRTPNPSLPRTDHRERLRRSGMLQANRSASRSYRPDYKFFSGSFHCYHLRVSDAHHSP